jgi:hypothetical protein
MIQPRQGPLERAAAGRSIVADRLTTASVTSEYEVLMRLKPVEIERGGGMQGWHGERWTRQGKVDHREHLDLIRTTRRLARAAFLNDWSGFADGDASRDARWAEMRNAGMTVREIGLATGASKSTVHDALTRLSGFDDAHERMVIDDEPRSA